MKFKRLLTVGLMALFCAGTALAASQLNAVRVTPRGNTATVSLQTTGSFAHKEYRPEEHMLLVDLTGVTSNPKLVRTVLFRSPVLKSYALSHYTSAAGTKVTRLALMLGNNVNARVHDSGSGLQVVLSGNGPASSSVASTAPAATEPTAMAHSTPGSSTKAASAKVAAPAAKATAKPVRASSHAGPAVAMATHPAIQHASAARSSAPTVIRSVSVRHEASSLDVVVKGPSEAHAYLLKNPDRLVVDFHNAVMHPASRHIAVGTKDVHEVRVGRFRSKPPVTRVVADLGGPRHFDLVPSAGQVVVRIKTEKHPVRHAVKPADPPASHKASKPASAAPQSKPEDAKVESKPSAASAKATPASAEASQQASNEKKAPEQSAASMAATAAPKEMAAVDPPPPAAAPEAASAAPVAPAAAPETAKPAAEVAQATPPAGVQLGSPGLRINPNAEKKPKYTGEPISVNLKDVDLKDFFRLIHEISGLNVVLDPAVHGRLTLVLDDVPWDQALDIVLKNNGLARELNGNVLRIATRETLRKEAVARRAEAEAQALAVNRQTITRSLSYAKASATVPTIKKFLSARGDVIADDRTNTLIISDIPSVLPNIDKLISELDQKTKEVEIEVRVVSATRSFARDIGFQLGFNWYNSPTEVGGLANIGTTKLVDSTTGKTLTTIPLFSNFPAGGASTGLNFSNVTSSYAVDAALTAAESHNLAKVLSRPRVVTQSNQKAEVKQGVKIPVYTSGTANANSSVQYIDAVMRLSVTPQITADNTIFLTVDVENTQPSGQLNGNYVLTTQQATTQVLVKDGATVVIGGVIQTTNSVSRQQTPLLGDIPLLGNLFKEKAVKTESDELIFFITPTIIRT